MKIVFEYPPLFEEIDAAFNVRHRPVIYAWGDNIFNPMRIHVPSYLLAHEAVHGARQGRDAEGWWRRYIADPAFRLQEEIPAHRAEYRSMLEQYGNNRTNRRRFMAQIASRLAAPLYGGVITRAEAAKAILQE